MGMFDWLMRGFGFDNQNKKSGKKQNAGDQKYANFNLHEKIGNDSVTFAGGNAVDSLNINMDRNIILHEPKTHRDVQLVVDHIRQNQATLVNLSGIGDQDVGRILDFLSGAIYALNGSICRIHDDQFLITPDGSKILRPENKDKQ